MNCFHHHGITILKNGLCRPRESIISYTHGLRGVQYGIYLVSKKSVLGEAPFPCFFRLFKFVYIFAFSTKKKFEQFEKEDIQVLKRAANTKYMTSRDAFCLIA